MDRSSQQTHAKWGDIVDDELGSGPSGSANRTLSGVIQEARWLGQHPGQQPSNLGPAGSAGAAAGPVKLLQRGGMEPPAAAAAASSSSSGYQQPGLATSSGGGAAPAVGAAWGDRRRWETDRTPGTHGRWEVLGISQS
ncbi:hypothetical protein OEZ85_013633 [Tetradesmus obliquus]|uniref:Uncharacterized protein n=1 Tax=Tetradesmus obliquus TaxID=3088 RepID=A0ABY8UQY4_TETOB|nr:hypothetical protein OEZ85_013633 [Tetradesmus obliquus]